MALQAPFNYLYRRTGRRGGPGPVFQVLSWALDDATFSPKGAVFPVTKPVLRVWIRRLDKSSRAPYYDISAANLQAQLLGYLRTGAYSGLQFSVRAHGGGRSKRFGLNVKPMEG